MIKKRSFVLVCKKIGVEFQTLPKRLLTLGQNNFSDLGEIAPSF